MTNLPPTSTSSEIDDIAREVEDKLLAFFSSKRELHKSRVKLGKALAKHRKGKMQLKTLERASGVPHEDLVKMDHGVIRSMDDVWAVIAALSRTK